MSERQRIKQILSLEERLAQEAKRLREQAKTLPPGPDREAILRKAQQTGSHMTEWIMSPGLRPPE
jgi:CBS domain containing-hemolysin-like protein